jgi:hypothetical protein
MFKVLIIAFLAAACGVPSNPATTDEPPPELPVEPPDDDGLEEGHNFCCQEINPDPEVFSGDGCVEIAEVHVALCNKLLYCPDKYKKVDGTVTCG